MEIEKCGFMDHGQGFPRSRDYGYDNFICKRKTCVSNFSETCISPSRCVIGKDGKCEGFLKKKVEKRVKKSKK